MSGVSLLLIFFLDFIHNIKNFNDNNSNNSNNNNDDMSKSGETVEEESTSSDTEEHRQRRRERRRREARRKKREEEAAAEAANTKQHYLEIQNLNQIPHWLAPCNLVAALFQVVQSLFLFGFAYQSELIHFLYTNYPSETLSEDDDEEEEAEIYAVPDPQEIASYSITWYAGAFILMAGIHHMLCVLPWTRPSYEYWIERHQTPSRWIQYSFSCALMKLHIAQVAGITDVHLLVMLFALSHVSMYLPYLHEVLNARARADGFEQNWVPFWMGVVPHMASWIVIFIYFFTSLERGQPPGFVSTVVVSLFLLESLFPLVFVLQWKKVGPFKDYLVGEFAFIIMSFTTKTFLAWTTLAGASGYAKNK